MTLPRIRANYPILGRGLEDLMEDTALAKRFANAVARKAGLRRGPAQIPPRTVIDAFIDPEEPLQARQYATDLSSATRMRMSSRSSTPVYVFASDNLSSALRPGDYGVVVGEGAVPIGAEASDTPEWRDFAFADRTVVRLTLSTDSGQVEWDASLFDGAFSVNLQVA